MQQKVRGSFFMLLIFNPSGVLLYPSGVLLYPSGVLLYPSSGFYCTPRTSALFRLPSVHRSPFTVSPFTVHRFTVLPFYRPFTVHRSPFTVHRFTVLPFYRAFTVHRSPSQRHIPMFSLRCLYPFVAEGIES